ncbi:hypothetical protein N9H57_07405 [Flavobacteriaceae bacterium]|nr:hypothetical protein [Flavobacteriaceae bacterium]
MSLYVAKDSHVRIFICFFVKILIYSPAWEWFIYIYVALHPKTHEKKTKILILVAGLFLLGTGIVMESNYSTDAVGFYVISGLFLIIISVLTLVTKIRKK